MIQICTIFFRGTHFHKNLKMLTQATSAIETHILMVSKNNLKLTQPLINRTNCRNCYSKLAHRLRRLLIALISLTKKYKKHRMIFRKWKPCLPSMFDLKYIPYHVRMLGMLYSKMVNLLSALSNLFPELKKEISWNFIYIIIFQNSIISQH